jgi:hypothetical protein
MEFPRREYSATATDAIAQRMAAVPQTALVEPACRGSRSTPGRSRLPEGWRATRRDASRLNLIASPSRRSPCATSLFIRGADVAQGVYSCRVFLHFAFTEIPVPRDICEQRIDRLTLVAGTVLLFCFSMHTCDQRPVLNDHSSGVA